jgi:hypothetical protein
MLLFFPLTDRWNKPHAYSAKLRYPLYVNRLSRATSLFLIRHLLPRLHRSKRIRRGSRLMMRRINPNSHRKPTHLGLRIRSSQMSSVHLHLWGQKRNELKSRPSGTSGWVDQRYERQSQTTVSFPSHHCSFTYN